MCRCQLLLVCHSRVLRLMSQGFRDLTNFFGHKTRTKMLLKYCSNELLNSFRQWLLFVRMFSPYSLPEPTYLCLSYPVNKWKLSPIATFILSFSLATTTIDPIQKYYLSLSKKVTIFFLVFLLKALACVSVYCSIHYRGR